jgi:hypothetical protein
MASGVYEVFQSSQPESIIAFLDSESYENCIRFLWNSIFRSVPPLAKIAKNSHKTLSIIRVARYYMARYHFFVRISADEFVDGGLKIEDTIEIAKCLESWGIDVINVSSGIYESSTTIVEPASFAQGWKKHLALAIKGAVSIPVKVQSETCITASF